MMVPSWPEGVPVGDHKASIQKIRNQFPTVSLDAKILSRDFNAKEGRYKVVTDIPRVFRHADMNEEVHMLLEGTIAEIIVRLEPILYRKYTWKNKNDKPMLFVKINKVLYGTLQAALILGGYYQIL